MTSCFNIQSATADWVKGVKETMLEFETDFRANNGFCKKKEKL